jgi:hypothetical protein
MKTRTIIITAFLLALGRAIPAATCEDSASYISQGRAFLAATNLTAANISFSNAVFTCASQQTGNVFYATTRLLTWPLRPAGSNFLNRLSVPNAGRDIYNWTAQPPADTNGVPPPPAGLNANESTAMLRTNILAELIGAEANLAKVTDTTFTLSLTSNETRSVAVTLDYGDIRMLRAMLQAAEYATYTAYSWDLNVPLGPLYSLLTNGQFSVERLLADHPALLTFATTNDLAAAKAALLAGANRYLEASQFIRNRPTNVVRLFNYDPEQAVDEANFRQTLADLTNSLAHAVTLTVYSNYTVFLGSQFTGTHPPRPFLPTIRGNGFGLGTLPDPTFGGLIYSTIPGIVEDSVEEFFARGLSPIPTIAPGLTTAGLQFQFPINTLKNRGYTVEVSTNLHDWTTSYAFFSFADGYAFADTNAYAPQRRFYRIVDRTRNMPPPPNDNFANRIPLTGLGITTVGYNASAPPEPGEPGCAYNSVWYSWTAPVSGLVAIGSDNSMGWHNVQVYTGSALNSLTNLTIPNTNGIYTWGPFWGPHCNGYTGYAVAGTTYQIQVCGDPGGIRLMITVPPALTVTSPQNGAASPVPTNFTISASATDGDGSITNLTFYTDGELLGSTPNPSLSMVWSNVGVGRHSVEVQATDNLGMTTTSNLTVYVRPSNDNFANRIAILGSSATLAGTNSGASKEPGEPNHAGQAGGASVWWSWTSPFNGYVTISVDAILPKGYPPGLSPPYLLAVYTNTSLSTLVPVASSQTTYTNGYRPQVCFVAAAGVSYQIAVDEQYDWPGIFTLRLIPTQPPLVGIISPVNGTVLTGPTNITITADATDNDGTISRVDFYNISTLIGSASASPYTALLSSPYGGSYTLMAKATDNMGASTWSAPVSISVQSPPFSVSITSPAEGAIFTAPANIPINASVFDPNGTVTQVRFGLASTSTIIGTDANSPYSVVWSNVGPGYYTIVAEAEDYQRNSVFSDPIDIVVTYPETTLTLGVPATGLSGGTGSEAYYSMSVPPGTSSLQISISGGTGDCDLYVAYGYQPDLFNYDYRPYLNGNNETVTVTNPPAGDWHIMLDGYNSYKGVTLIAQ